MIQVNRIYLIFNRLVTKKFLVDTSVGKYSLQYYLNHIQTAMVTIAIVSHLHLDFPCSHYVEWLLISVLMTLFSYIALLVEKRFKVLRIMTGLE